MKRFLRSRSSVLPAIGSLLAGWLLLVSCDDSDRLTGGSDETHSSVMDVQGRVLTSDARPLSNVIVRLRNAGFVDTTDSQGAFRLQSDSFPAVGISPAVVDTLDYLRDGQVILSVPVPAWVAILPDVMLVQRDISGAILGDGSAIAKVQGLLGLPDGSSQKVELEWSSFLGRYSGFAYFRYSGGRDSFRIRIDVLDDSGRLLGRSAALRFTSLSGDLAIPTFAMANILPKVILRAGSDDFFETTGLDTMLVARGDSVRVFAQVPDSLSRFASLEWKLEGSTWNRQTGAGSVPRDPTTGISLGDVVFGSVFRAPADKAPGTVLMLRARVQDRDGAYQTDSLALRIVEAPPRTSIRIVSPGKPHEVLPGGAVRLAFEETPHEGRTIVSRTLHLARRLPSFTVTMAQCLSIATVWGPGQTAEDAWIQRWEDEATTPPPGCGESVTARLYTLDSIGPGRNISGADTTIQLPADSLGEFAFVYTVVDQFGERGASSSAPISARQAAPEGVEVRSEGDSLVVRWSAPVGSTAGGAWILAGRWNEDGDSLRLELPESARRWALLQPLDARSVHLRLMRRGWGVDGFPLDTLVANLGHPGLRFTGASRDSTRLGGYPFSFGSAVVRFAGALGTRLAGEVATLSWSVEDTTEISGVGVNFPMHAPMDARTFELDLANPSGLPVRIELTASAIEAYERARFSGAGMGWNLPAGAQGRVVLSVDSLSWPDWFSPEDRPSVSVEDLIAATDGVVLTVVRNPGPGAVGGQLELDNLGWKSAGSGTKP
jgi:hypothetical protein